MAIVNRCAYGCCRSAGTSKCGKCKVTWYCGRDCQKRHYKTHKRHCRAHSPMPAGKFAFFALPREIGDQIYEELVVARFSPDLQKTYDRYTQIYKSVPSYGLRKQIDELEERLMINFGDALKEVEGFQPLVDSSGLLLANEQLNEELTEIMYSRNTFLVAVGDSFKFTSNTAARVFIHAISTSALARIRRLIISIRDDIPPGEHEYIDIRIDTIKHNMMHVVNALNAAGNSFKLLKLRYISAMAGDLERKRAAVDALLQSPSAPEVHLHDSPTAENQHSRTYHFFKHDRLVAFCRPAYHIGDALSFLGCSVEQFMIYGDLPGAVIGRLERKFNVKELTADSEAEMAANEARIIEKYRTELADFSLV